MRARYKSPSCCATVVKDGSRIEAAGKGALEPRYQPADQPENRRAQSARRNHPSEGRPDMGALFKNRTLLVLIGLLLARLLDLVRRPVLRVRRLQAARECVRARSSRSRGGASRCGRWCCRSSRCAAARASDKIAWKSWRRRKMQDSDAVRRAPIRRRRTAAQALRGSDRRAEEVEAARAQPISTSCRGT